LHALEIPNQQFGRTARVELRQQTRMQNGFNLPRQATAFQLTGKMMRADGFGEVGVLSASFGVGYASLGFGSLAF
jgi:hypothetical protein